MRLKDKILFSVVKVNRQETRADEIEGRVCNGSYIWRIENYRQHRQDAISGIATAAHSPAIYTSLYGYKLCLRINLNGVASGVGRYIALFVHMMKGDYDGILEWPFTGRITLTILDQSEGTEVRQHISDTLIATPNLLAFQRPTAPRNYKGYGYVDFAPIEHIREPQYIKNNTMLVRFQIDHWSTHLPSMWPGFDSQIQGHMWVEFVASLLCTERFSPGTPVSPLQKKNIWFDSC